MSDRELAYQVSGLTAGLVALIALAGWSLGGTEQAAGALVGGALTIANFLWLRWTAGVALRGRPALSGRALRQALWVGVSAARFGVIALAVGLATTQGWLGLTGLLVSLLALPVMVVAAGLRAARVA